MLNKIVKIITLKYLKLYIIYGGFLMKAKNRKVVLIGAGMVGMSFAYQLYSSGLCEELGLIDFFAEKQKVKQWILTTVEL